jgi:fructose-1,6-bisphosphatase/inositol monophosphatase family enzyme
MEFSADLEVDYKTSRDIVTAADLASQDCIVEMISTAFPGDDIVAEEGDWRTPEGASWVIDPLDGTVNYSRGLPLYGVCIAYVNASGEIELGVVHLPALAETYWASSGGGAFLNDSRLSVSSTSRLDRALVDISDFNTGPEGRREHFNALKVQAIDAVHTRAMRTKNLSSAAVETAWVAAGRLDAYLMVFCHFWDFAAGALLIREAGGLVSDLQGQPLAASSGLVLCSNRALHPELKALFSPLAKAPDDS